MVVIARSENIRHFPSGLRQPCEVWQTPFWFRLFLAGLGVVGATLASFALATVVCNAAFSGVASDSLRTIITGVLAVFLSALAVRYQKPFDAEKWFRLALTPDGLYLPARDSETIFVPWSAVISVGVAHWEGRGRRSVARLALDLDEAMWMRFGRDANVNGEGRVRRVDIRIVDATGEEITGRINAYRDGTPDPLG